MGELEEPRTMINAEICLTANRKWKAACDSLAYNLTWRLFLFFNICFLFYILPEWAFLGMGMVEGFLYMYDEVLHVENTQNAVCEQYFSCPLSFSFLLPRLSKGSHSMDFCIHSVLLDGLWVSILLGRHFHFIIVIKYPITRHSIYDVFVCLHILPTRKQGKVPRLWFQPDCGDGAVLELLIWPFS